MGGGLAARETMKTEGSGIKIKRIGKGKGEKRLINGL